MGTLRRTTVAAGLGAVLATSVVAAALHAAGFSFEVDGEMIPLAGFAQMPFVGAVIGGVVPAVLNRRSRSTRRRFIQSAVALVALHVLAAVVVVPALVRHAND